MTSFTQFRICCSHSGAVEDSNLLGCYTVSTGKQLLTCLRTLFITFIFRVKKTKFRIKEAKFMVKKVYFRVKQANFKVNETKFKVK